MHLPLHLFSISSSSAQDSDPKGSPYQPGDVVAVPVEDEGTDAEEEEFRDPYGVASEGRRADQISAQVRYVLEGIVVVGNKRTKAHTVRKFIPLKQGDFLDPESPELVATEWRLMGTGWFDSVDIRLESLFCEGGKIEITIKKENGFAVIDFSDNGSGMTKDIQEKIIISGK